LDKWLGGLAVLDLLPDRLSAAAYPVAAFGSVKRVWLDRQSLGTALTAAKCCFFPDGQWVLALLNGGAAAAWPLVARAQLTAKLPSIKWTALENSAARP
jgi:hypothetical protein